MRSPTSLTRRSLRHSRFQSGLSAPGCTAHVGPRNGSSPARLTIRLSRRQELIGMDELDLFRDFRTGVAAPTGDAERRASARLREATDGRHGPATRVLQLMRKRRGGTTLVLASLAGAVAAALFVSGPWTDSPGFLEKAQAALAPPADSVVHMRWMTTRTSIDFGCTVAVGPNESWVDQTPPNRYRLIDRNLLPPRAVDRREIACAADTPIEFGGTLAPSHSVRFVPPNTLTSR